MTYISISEGAKVLSILDGQLQEAIRSERRWNLAVREAAENRQRAHEAAEACRKAIKAIAGELAR